MKNKFLLLLLTPLLSLAQWTQIGQDIGGENNSDHSGFSVDISSNGNIVAIGAPSNNTANGNSSGHVRIYHNNGGVWEQIGQDIDGASNSDYSGSSVSLSSDGNIVAIAAPYNDSLGDEIGEVRVYQNIGGNWQQIGQDIHGEAQLDYSGRSINLSSDGSILAIGSELNDGNGINSGHVRIYHNNGGVWEQIGQDIDGEAIYDALGKSVSLSSDGNILAIGARFNDGNGADSGHVRVYQNNGGNWEQIGQDIDGENVGDRSGYSISLSADGSIVAISSILNDGNGVDSGHVRVFQNNGGSWQQIGQDIDGENVGDQSGHSINLSADGSIVAISSVLNDGNGVDSGHVRVFQNNGGSWQQIDQDIDGENAGDQSGFSNSLSADGRTVAIGANLSDENGIYSGHVRIYSLPKLSIQENSFGSNLSVYPNPSSGISKIQLDKNHNTIKVSIFNSLGNKIAIQESNNTNLIILNTQDYSVGVYYIQLQSENQKATIKLAVE